MHKYSISEFKNFCNNNDIIEYILESNGISDVMGSECKLKLIFSSAIIAEEFDIITFKSETNTASIMYINSITNVSNPEDDVQTFGICCGFEDDLKMYKLYIRLNKNEENKHSHKCIMCNNTFNIFDTYNGLSVRKVFGYGSKFDGDEIELNFCIKCLDEIVLRNNNRDI